MYLLLLLFIVIPFTQSPPTEHDLTSSNFMFSRTDAVSYGVNPRLIECTNAEREQVTESWKGARIFAAAHAKWRPAADYQETMTKYLGSQTSRSGRENMPVVQGEVEGPIWRRILQVAGVFTSTPGNPSPGHVRIYCDENVVFARDRPAQRCGPDGPVTYSWANEVSHLLGQAGRSRTEQYNHIVLCPSFFEDYLTLDQVESVADTSTTWSQYIDPWLSSRARSILHGVYHWSPYPIDPPCDMRPELNQPEEVIELATQKNTYGSPPDTKGAYHNADSWVQAAIAIYIQKKYQSGIVPGPMPDFREQRNVLKSGDQTAARSKFSVGRTFKDIYFDSPPASLNSSELVTLNTTSIGSTAMSMGLKSRKISVWRNSSSTINDSLHPNIAPSKGNAFTNPIPWKVSSTNNIS